MACTATRSAIGLAAATPQNLALLLVDPARVFAHVGSDAAAWVQMAENEGVVSLLHARLNGREDVPAELQRSLTEAARMSAAYALAFQAQSRRILMQLQKTDTPVLLLKGAALAHWAYDKPHLRSCGDVDILLPTRHDAERLAQALAVDGFDCSSPSGGLVAYEMMCSKPMSRDWALEVDIHWQLTNSTLFARSFDFDELMAGSQPLPNLGTNAHGLGPVHAVLHAAMHRALNVSVGIEDRLKWQYDFIAIGGRLKPGHWSQLVSMATGKQLAGVLLAALRSAGENFANPWPEDVMKQLEFAAQSEPLDASRLDDWAYMQAQTMRALPGWGPKLRWLWQRVFPSRDYMTYLYGDQGSYGGLLRERLKRAWRKWRG